MYLSFLVIILVFFTFIPGNTPVYDMSGNMQVGYITSGIPSPTLKQNVAMGYIDTKLANSGTEVKLQVRNNQIDAVVSKMPFVPSNYYQRM